MRVFLVHASIGPEVGASDPGLLVTTQAPGEPPINAFPTRQKPPIAFQLLIPILSAQGWEPLYVDLRALIEAGTVALDDLCSSWTSWVQGQGHGIWAFTTNAQSYPTVVRLSAACKRADPRNRVVHGGPQASALGSLAFEHFAAVDYVVSGDGEEAFPALLSAVSTGSRTGVIPGVITREDGLRASGTPRRPLDDLNSLPFPAYAFAPWSAYDEFPGRQHLLVETGRGCKNSCAFCSVARSPVREKSVARVIAEIERAAASFPGLAQITFVSNALFSNEEKVVRFCQQYACLGASVPWGCFARIDALSPATIDCMRSADCRVIHYGVESGAPAIQRAIKKPLAVDRIVEAVSETRRAGIQPVVNFVIGFPEETLKTLNESLELMLRLSLAGAMIYPTVLSPHIGTSYHQRYHHRLVLNQRRRVEVPLEEDWVLIEALPEIFSYFYYVLPEHVPLDLIESLYFGHIEAGILHHADALDRALQHYERDHVRLHCDWSSFASRHIAERVESADTMALFCREVESRAAAIRAR